MAVLFGFCLCPLRRLKPSSLNFAVVLLLLLYNVCEQEHRVAYKVVALFACLLWCRLPHFCHTASTYKCVYTTVGSLYLSSPLAVISLSLQATNLKLLRTGLSVACCWCWAMSTIASGPLPLLAVRQTSHWHFISLNHAGAITGSGPFNRVKGLTIAVRICFQMFAHLLRRCFWAFMRGFNGGNITVMGFLQSLTRLCNYHFAEHQYQLQFFVATNAVIFGFYRHIVCLFFYLRYNC